MTDIKTIAETSPHAYHCVTHDTDTCAITGVLLGEMVNLEVSCHQFTLVRSRQ